MFADGGKYQSTNFDKRKIDGGKNSAQGDI